MGNIIIIKDGMDFSRLPNGIEDRILRDFLVMKENAEKAGDIFYAQPEVLNTIDFYKPWNDSSIRNCISEIGFSNFVQYCFKYPKPFRPISPAAENPPRTDGGLETTPLPPRPYIYNTDTWNKWRNDWRESQIDFFSCHPDKIDWSHATNDLLPEPQFMLEIMKQELKNNHIKVTTIQALHQLILSKGADKIACITRIGSEICRVNYYIEEKDLSSREHQRTGSLRKIFSIIRNGHKQYISLDFEKGVFEFFNEHGIHQGEYYFNGSFIEGSIRKDEAHQLHFE